MDKKTEKPQDVYPHDYCSEMTIEDVISSVKDCADQIERLALRITNMEGVR